MPASASIGALKDGHHLVSSAKERAELLNTQFTSVFSTPTEKADYTSATLSPKVDEIPVCMNGVFNQLKALKLNKAAGPDGIASLQMFLLDH